jgi:phage-related protein
MREIILYCFESGKCPVEEFFDSLTQKQFEKTAFVLDLIEQSDIIPHEYFKKLKGTDEIWEVRIRYGNNIFRLLGFFDTNNFIILNHAFTKKSQKTPKKEIEIAEQRKKDYFKQKR